MLGFVLGLTTTYNKKVEFRNSLTPRRVGQPLSWRIKPVLIATSGPAPTLTSLLGSHFSTLCL